MPNSNNGQVVLGLDIPKTVNQINADIKKLEKQLEQVKATGVLDTDKTVKQLNAQIKSLQTQLKTIEIKATVDQKSIQKTGQQIGSQIKNTTKGSSVASEILNASDLDKQGKTYILKVSNTIEATKKEIQSKLRNSGYFDIEIKGVEKANGQIKSIIVNATNAKGVLEQLNFERAKMQKGGKVTNALVQTDDVKVLGTISSSIDKVQGNLSTLKSKWEEQGVLVGDFKTKVEQLENSIVSVGSKGELSGLESQIKALKTEASQIAEVNKIQLSIDDKSYEAEIARIAKGFTALSGDANEAKTHVQALQNDYKKMQDATDDNSRLQAEKNYQLALAKTKNELIIAQAEAKEYVDVLRVNKLRNDIQDWLKKNTAATKEAKDAMQSYLNMLDSDKVSYLDFNTAKSGMDDWDTAMRQAGKLGNSITETFKQGAKSFLEWTTASGAVMEVWTSVKQGVKELKELDDILTEISKTSDLTEKQLAKLGDTAFESASKYGKTASDYLTGVQEMYRAGFDNAEEMAELSILAQSAGDMETNSANDYLLATNAAYKYKGSVEALNKVLDSQNYITNNAAISMQDIADATTETASVAAQYGVQISELSALIATATANTRESGSEVGTALKSILINLQDTTSKPVTDTFNALGISMTKVVNGAEQLKTPIELIYELANAYNSLPEGDVMRATILNEIGQKRHANTLAAVLSDMESYHKMLDLYNSSSAENSAFREAQKSAENWSGTWNKVKNSWSDLLQNFANTDAIIGALNAVNGLINGLDKLGAVGTGLLGAGIFASVKNAGKYA
mgnify:CR=1 FL=1